MVKKIFFSTLLILSGCTYSSKKEQNMPEQHFYVLSNNIVDEEIVKYNTSISKNKKLINLTIRVLNDTTYYEIREVIDGSELISSESTFFVNTRIGLITVRYVNPSIMFKSIKGVRMSEKEAWNIIKRYFPEEYEFYIKREKRSYITDGSDVFIEERMPTTGGSVVWRLKFINEKYVEKMIFTER